MTQVLPAIIPKIRVQLEEEIKSVSGFATRVQVDIADGVFAKPLTWPYNGRDEDYFTQLKGEDVGWPCWEDVDIELHLMVKNPEEVLLDWIKTGIVSVVVHIEATEQMEKIIDMCQEYIVSLGIAIKPSTDIARLAPFVPRIDFIQCMGSDNIGHHGEKLDERVFKKIKTLRELHPERIISVDIGVTEDTAPELIEAGATKLITGSAILESPHPREVFEHLSSL